MIPKKIVLAAVSLFGILVHSLPEKLNESQINKQQSPNRLVFAHFMVGLTKLTDYVPVHRRAD